ncbi:hypothetical protein O8C80_04200 [Aliarcobacter butzleri]|uniref:hypothetical protein n=1 Tax=Aliarcobacter butzleri TaxID=28197 RepID=UPI00263EDFC7|nr:hypothetical protein [Aliarcobacter butzleri]MDN5042536.1 hypothetical protein [Aliarcobacter butzleri]
MDKLPQRDDLIYKEIEEFQDYELTNCVAYEMAIRNKDINALVNEYLKKEFTFLYLEENNKDIELLKEYGFNFEAMIITQILGVLKQDINLFSGKIRTNEVFNCDILKNRTNNNSLVYFEKGNFFYESFDDKDKIIKKIDKNDINKDFISFLRCNFKRPKLYFQKNKIAKIDINLNLPKEELIAYISKIKDEYDKDNSIIKTPLELLGETLEKSDNKKTPKKPKAFVYADWFYIYDYWKYEKTQGKTDKDIFVALEVENNVPYKEDMIRKIRDKMKYFIDDLGYKELITGVKNS